MGYFDDNKKEYVITDMFPRRPLINYLWNEKTVCQCDQFAKGYAWTMKEGYKRMIENGERNVYIKNLQTGEVYSATRNYDRLPFSHFNAKVGLGYHTVESEYKNVAVNTTIVVPVDGTVVLYRIEVINNGSEKQDLHLYFCNQPQPDISGHEAYGYADYNEQMRGIDYWHEGFALPSDLTHVYLSSSEKPIAYECSKSGFCGTYGSFENPEGVKQEFLNSKGTSFEQNYVGAMQFAISLKGGEKRSLYFACGTAKSLDESIEHSKMVTNEEYFEHSLNSQIAFNDEYLSVFKANTPDSVVNSHVNIWLKRQLSLGKTWGRLYGKGFRDVMQDITAFVSLDPKLARERILNAVKWTFEDGNPIRMFEPSMYYPYNDGGAWIPTTVLSYLNESGDLTILDEQLPYLVGSSEEKCGFGIPTRYEKYQGTQKTDSLLCHIKRSVDYLCGCKGKRGLVLFRGGDWNDSLNNVGREGKGESVWLSIATVKAINEFIEILRIINADNEQIQEYTQKRDELAKAVLKWGLDGDHLIYGYNDYDEKIGASECEFAKIFLNPQTWAVLANLTDKKQLESFMDSVESRLKCDFGYLQCYPSFKKGSDKIGRVSYFQPGLVENGAVYNHGVAFKIVADCLLGRGNNAYNSLKAISFDNPKNPNNGMEPYAVSNMYMGIENKYIAGYAPMSWITGTAGWLYRCISEYICGLQATVNGLKILPCVPDIWNEFRVERKFRGAIYKIKFIRKNNFEIKLNGKKIEGNVLPILQKGETAEVTVSF
ncbi:MAG: hypothetical protein IKJ19_00075 [Clostridia bacterium]|nr:hypothetical protein [Clostridia bacterium]